MRRDGGENGREREKKQSSHFLKLNLNKMLHKMKR